MSFIDWKINIICPIDVNWMFDLDTYKGFDERFSIDIDQFTIRLKFNCSILVTGNVQNVI